VGLFRVVIKSTYLRASLLVFIERKVLVTHVFPALQDGVCVHEPDFSAVSHEQRVDAFHADNCASLVAQLVGLIRQAHGGFLKFSSVSGIDKPFADSHGGKTVDLNPIESKVIASAAADPQPQLFGLPREEHVLLLEQVDSGVVVVPALGGVAAERPVGLVLGVGLVVLAGHVGLLFLEGVVESLLRLCAEV